jgi:diguanylate cyclase (GGDEF)-like protein
MADKQTMSGVGRVTAMKVALALIVAGSVFGAAFWLRADKTVLRVGYNHFPPYVLANANGAPTGMAVQMIKEAAKRANISLRWVAIPGSAEDAYQAHSIDVYPLLTLTKARKSSMHLSPAWWEDELVLVSLRSQPVTNQTQTANKRIATRMGYVQALAAQLFPKASFVVILPPQRVARTLCSGDADAFFVDSRVLTSELLDGLEGCTEDRLSVASVPNARVSLGTSASIETADVADRLYQQIAQLALDGSLAKIGVEWGLFSPYGNGQMKAMVDAQRRADLTTRGCVIAIVILIAFCFQNLSIRRARKTAQEAHAEAEQSRIKLFHQANHDALTGLVNRRFFEQNLNQIVAEVALNGIGVGLVYFDLDGFKAVNDIFGHETGDDLLRAVARSLEAAFEGEGHVIARMGGDEFAMTVRQPEIAIGIASQLLSVLQGPFQVQGHTFRISGSIGLSLWVGGKSTAETLLRSADFAMYEAKRRGKNQIQIFNQETEAPSRSCKVTSLVDSSLSGSVAKTVGPLQM